MGNCGHGAKENFLRKTEVRWDPCSIDRPCDESSFIGVIASFARVDSGTPFFQPA